MSSSVLIGVLMACFLTAISIERDDVVDPYDPKSIQLGILRTIDRQVQIQEQQLNLQRHQVELLSQLNSKMVHTSIFIDALKVLAFLAFLYAVAVFLRRYGLALAICFFVHFCHRRKRKVISARMPRSTGIPSPPTSIVHEPDIPLERVRIFGARAAKYETTAI